MGPQTSEAISSQGTVKVAALPGGPGCLQTPCLLPPSATSRAAHCGYEPLGSRLPGLHAAPWLCSLYLFLSPSSLFFFPLSFYLYFSPLFFLFSLIISHSLLFLSAFLFVSFFFF